MTGTPAYMSPEQVSGNEPVDTRSDIYSLGVLLCELLAGPSTHLPEDLMERNFEEARHLIHNANANIPSVALGSRSQEKQNRIALARDVPVEHLLAWCRNELDWVVGKAVVRDPSARYQTVDALAADVVRWLHNEPVASRPQTRRYRLAKLVKRNRLWFGAGTLAFVGLTGGFGVATLLFFREREARSLQEKLRVQAEMAHNTEKHARTNWEYRFRVADSAVRLRYEDFAGAEELVAPIPAEETPASLEAVSVFKELATWHRSAGRMEQAQRCFLATVNALSRIDRAHTDSNSDNFLPAATALALSPNPHDYESLRRIALDLYANTESHVVAERTLKACLLRPASDAELARMRKLAELVEGLTTNGTSEHTENCSLGSGVFCDRPFHFRESRDDLAESWARRGLAGKKIDPTCGRANKVVLALALNRQGKREEALEFLKSAAHAVGEKLKGTQPHGNVGTGFWWDWANLRILLDEAGWSEDKD